MTNGVQTNPSPAAAAQSPSSAPASNSAQVTKNMFLQLLVAQLKNQDPLNPTDGTQFMTQLAQMQQLEQSLNMSQDIQAIRESVDKLISGGAAEPAQA